MGEPLTVLQAALLVDGATITLPRPARNSDLLRHSAKHPPPDGQGFLLSDGSYATRERAWEVAHAAGQPILRHPEVQCGPYLFSEDLW